MIASGATAVFAANDQMALGLIGGLRAAGVAVPERISIVGFDDIPEAAYAWPPLTTVRQDFEEVAHRAVAQLIATPGSAVDQGASDPIAPILVVRDSVVPPPA